MYDEILSLTYKMCQKGENLNCKRYIGKYLGRFISLRKLFVTNNSKAIKSTFTKGQSARQSSPAFSGKHDKWKHVGNIDLFYFLLS